MEMNIQVNYFHVQIAQQGKENSPFFLKKRYFSHPMNLVGLCDFIHRIVNVTVFS